MTTVLIEQPTKRRSPTSKEWDHQRKCFTTRELADRSRLELRARLGNRINGKKVRWRLKVCPVCSGIYVQLGRP